MLYPSTTERKWDYNRIDLVFPVSSIAKFPLFLTKAHSCLCSSEPAITRLVPSSPCPSLDFTFSLPSVFMVSSAQSLIVIYFAAGFCRLDDFAADIAIITGLVVFLRIRWDSWCCSLFFFLPRKWSFSLFLLKKTDSCNWTLPEGWKLEGKHSEYTGCFYKPISFPASFAVSKSNFKVSSTWCGQCCTNNIHFKRICIRKHCWPCENTDTSPTNNIM